MAVSSTRPGGYAQALETDDPLVLFLYTLMRDQVPPGAVEGIVAGWEQRPDGVTTSQLSNDWLAAYAYELACRLRSMPPVDALQEAHVQVQQAQARPTYDAS